MPYSSALAQWKCHITDIRQAILTIAWQITYFQADRHNSSLQMFSVFSPSSSPSSYRCRCRWCCFYFSSPLSRSFCFSQFVDDVPFRSALMFQWCVFRCSHCRASVNAAVLHWAPYRILSVLLWLFRAVLIVIYLLSYYNIIPSL